MNKSQIILSGTIFENNLIDYPQHFLMNADNKYKLLIGDPHLTFLIQVTSQNLTITIPILNNSSEFEINWGDGSTDHNKSHRYKNAGEYYIIVIGLNNAKLRFTVSNNEWTNKLLEIVDWGIDPIIDLTSAFYNANLLRRIPDYFFPFDVVNATSCFENCTSLTKLPDNFIINNCLENIDKCFKGCTNFNLNNFLDKPFTLPDSIVSLNNLFENCKSLTYIPEDFFQNLNTNFNNQFNGIFAGCSNLSELSESFLIPPTVTSLLSTFINCTSLTSMGNIQIPETCTHMNSLFENCTSLKKIPETFQFPKNVLDLSRCFYNCSSLEYLPNTIWPGAYFNLNNNINIDKVFYDCKNLLGTAPQFKLWRSETKFYSHTVYPDYRPLTFYNCTQLFNYNYIPVHWGGLGKQVEYDSCYFEIYIDAENEIFSLPLHKTYKKLTDYTDYTKFSIENAYYNYSVDWGDGTDINTLYLTPNTNGWDSLWNNDPTSIYYEYLNGFPTVENPNSLVNSSISAAVQHKYSTPGYYLIELKKQIKSLNYGIDTLYVHLNDSFTWRHLIAIYSLGKTNELYWKSFHNMFCNASILEAIPNEELISQTVTNDKHVYDISYMFYNCPSLNHIPVDFEIHKNTTNLSYMFYNSFRTQDTVIPNSYNDIFPTNGLLAKNIDISHCFENCITLNRFNN